MCIMSKIIILKNKILVLFTKNWWLTPLTIFLIWRISLEIIGQFFYWINISSLRSINYSQSIWWRWDSDWYGTIVNYGYNLGNGQQPNVTFFPLYPLLWKIVMTVTRLPNYLSALLVSNSLALGSFIIFYHWLSIVWGDLVAKRGLVALAIFPTSFFLLSVYSESTLLFLIVSMFLLSAREKWIGAAAVALLASAARPVGVFLWPILFWLWYEKNKDVDKKNKTDILSIIFLPPLGLLFFSLYMWNRFGDPLVWLHGQGSYGRNLISPIRLLTAYCKNIFTLGEFWVRHLFEMAAMLFVVGCLPKLKKLHPVYAFLAVLNLLPSLFSNTLTSIQRFTLMIVPVFVIVAMQRKSIYILYLFISFFLLIFSIYQFINFNWAG